MKRWRRRERGIDGVIWNDGVMERCRKKGIEKWGDEQISIFRDNQTDERVE